ncbi:uncharacterized protein EV422DRAFT_570940 [Fimicolochytrium jonesii]|uniref:uncharacterized protein n=1 Tax=Fimicolochytrium jonesii TaxID=1396493 RepID=UPI0022FE88CE|nr:uncharacterized protein EV422DRAFT_570940 [Fimicolochytrium jonesii]KAI8817325.1 hypothetical protein EV422DRAFT_570940 [Fimicolochytrium jonesii]
MGSPNWHFYNQEFETADDTTFQLHDLVGTQRGGEERSNKQLQALFARFTTGNYKDEDRSIMILCFPAANLRAPTKGADDLPEATQDGYGVTFPIGKRWDDINTHPFLAWLKSERPTHSEFDDVDIDVEPPHWLDYEKSIDEGFEMFLVDCFGYTVGRWSGSTPLEDLVPYLEEAFNAFNAFR